MIESHDSSSTMTSKREAFLYTYRTALDLNNAAVSLLHNGCPAEAFKNSKDALSLMQKALNSSHSQDEQMNALHAAEKHQEELLCQDSTQEDDDDMSWPSPPLSSSSSSERKSRLFLFCKGLEVNELDDDDLSAVKFTAMYGPSTSIFFPIRICESHSLDVTLKSETARHMGILLYNNGLLKYILAMHHESKPEKSEAMLQGSIKLLSLAQHAFHQWIQHFPSEKVPSKKNDESYLDARNVRRHVPCVLLSIITLNCLSNALRSAGNCDDSDNAQQKATDLLAAFCAKESSRPGKRGTAAAA